VVISNSRGPETLSALIAEIGRDILKMRGEQVKQERQARQPPLFEMHEDARPVSQRSSDGRYSEPTLFDPAKWRGFSL